MTYFFSLSSPADLLPPALITALALLLYQLLSLNVGRARGRYAVPAPAVSGSSDFERYYRVQMNTLEQLAFFLPSFWLAVIFARPMLADLLGVAWILGRILYANGYYNAPKNRGPGFAIAMFASVFLWLGASAGIVHWMLKAF